MVPYCLVFPSTSLVIFFIFLSYFFFPSPDLKIFHYLQDVTPYMPSSKKNQSVLKVPSISENVPVIVPVSNFSLRLHTPTPEWQLVLISLTNKHPEIKMPQWHSSFSILLFS